MFKKIIALFLILSCSLIVGPPAFAETTQQSITTTRLAGQTRYETAKAISEQYNQGKVKNVILSTSNGFADALSASVLAHQKDAPIMLVDSSVAGSKEAFDYVTQHLDSTGTVYVIGGTGIIGKAFETRLNDLGFKNVVRIAGNDRYDTSYQLALSLNNTSISTVVISSGESYPDALSIASFAANKGWPILLTPKDALPKEMKDYLSEEKPSKVYITGGVGVISDNVKSEISGLLPQANIERLSGQSRFDTNATIAQTFKSNPSTVYLATGYGFADAISGSALAAKNGDPIIFIDPSTQTLPKSVASYYVKLNASNLSPNIVVFGGNGVISDEVLKNSIDLISGVVKEDSIYSIPDITAAVTVNQNYPLPETVQAKLYNSDIIDVPVKWEPSSVDTSTVGSSTFEGVVDGYSKSISLIVNVEQVDDGTLARVKINDRYGYINKSGKIVFYDEYDSIGELNFSEGLKVVSLNSKYGFIDHKGNIVISLKYDKCGSFHEGLAPVWLNKKMGYIDKNGQEIIPIQYSYFTGTTDNLSYFSEGMAVVSQGYNYLKCKDGFIDKAGNLVIPYKYSACKNFSEGFAVVLSDGGFGFIDQTGTEVIPCKYEDCESFQEGLAVVKLNGKRGVIDKNGTEVVPIKYDLCGSFRDGFAAVELNGKWGIVDKTGQEVVPLKYDYCGQFQDGLALAMLNGKYGYIDKNGQEVVPLKYFWCYQFQEGLAVVVLNGETSGYQIIGKRGVIDKYGKTIVPSKYDGMGDFVEGLAVVVNDGKCGFIDKTGKEVIPLVYDYVYGFSK